MHSGSSEAEEENDPDGAFAFRRKAGCVYHSVCPTLHPYLFFPPTFACSLIICQGYVQVSVGKVLTNYNWLSRFLFLPHPVALLRLVWIREEAGHGVVRTRVGRVTRDSDILSPAFQRHAAVWGWHVVGWDEAAGKSLWNKRCISTTGAFLRTFQILQWHAVHGDDDCVGDLPNVAGAKTQNSCDLLI